MGCMLAWEMPEVYQECQIIGINTWNRSKPKMKGEFNAPVFFPSRIPLSSHRLGTRICLRWGIYQALESHVSTVSHDLTWCTISEALNTNKSMAACFRGQTTVTMKRPLKNEIISRLTYNVPMLIRCPTYAQTQMYITPHPIPERIHSLCGIHASSLNAMSLHLTTSGQKWKTRVFIGEYNAVKHRRWGYGVSLTNADVSFPRI